MEFGFGYRAVGLKLRKVDKLLTQLNILARQCDEFELFVQRINSLGLFVSHPVCRIRKRRHQPFT